MTCEKFTTYLNVFQMSIQQITMPLTGNNLRPFLHS